ncbi:membrane fusion protein, protease secretion system [Pseudomonas cuatrocienegasensis]|uniref:Membrane fusion protein (MFP) family protein n=1 Tax=Pseudomonas cuatrocienegasensis TaxID=543360 RepID=A0ABY1BHB7_9PSED|nr:MULTISPECIES: HlyD family type I secretion periplasmic adaptor subunit [Pseudomonas]OEC33317.1 hemolysin D [Pseudomonas sp. 21C1]SEQ87551.1 membrane fusion protein, protease secretion system [Pseudomonas cuatrocienegasensis]
MSAPAQVYPLPTADARSPARLGWWLLLGGFGGFLLWAALAPLDKGVPVSATVMVSGNRQAVQHPTGGRVLRILARDGERVSAGQALLELDGEALAAQADALRAQLIGSRASEARLAAERDAAEAIDFHPWLLQRPDDPLVVASLELQRQLFASRRQSLALELDGLAQTLAGSEAQLGGLQALRNSKQAQLRVLDEQLVGLRELAADNYIPRNRLLDIERQRVELSGLLADDFARIGQLQRQIAELRLRAGQRRAAFQEQVRSQLAEAQIRSEELHHRLLGVELEQRRTLLRAPAGGLVVGLSVFTEGGVVSPGQALMEIVPEDQPLLVEGRLSPALVDKVHPGLAVELLFSAFEQSSTPRVTGLVELVSADRLQDERSGEPYYALRIRVDEAGTRQLAGLRIRPGMPVEAFVRTGERSLLNYLFKPLLDRTHLAMAEE